MGGLNPFDRMLDKRNKMSATKASGCFRKVTVRFQDASHGYNQDAGCLARKRQGFRMFQDVSQGCKKVSGCYAGLQ